MSEAKKVIEVIRKILTEINGLSDENFQKLLNGELALKFEGKVGKKTLPESDMATLKEKLYAYQSEGDAIKFLTGIKGIKVDDFKAFAKYLSCPINTRAKKDEIIRQIVRSTVGLKLNTEAYQKL